MNIWSWRALLLTLLAGSLMIRAGAIRERERSIETFDFAAAMTGVIAAGGHATLPNPVAPPKVLSAIVYIARHDCAEPSMALPFYLNQAAAPLLDRATAGKPYTYRYHFIERAWPDQTRLALNTQWLKHAALALVGSTPYRPVRRAVAVADPAGCAPVPVQWRDVWRRSTGPDASQVATSSTSPTTR